MIGEWLHLVLKFKRHFDASFWWKCWISSCLNFFLGEIVSFLLTLKLCGFSWRCWCKYFRIHVLMCDGISFYMMRSWCCFGFEMDMKCVRSCYKFGCFFLYYYCYYHLENQSPMRSRRTILLLFCLFLTKKCDYIFSCELTQNKFEIVHFLWVFAQFPLLKAKKSLML